MNKNYFVKKSGEIKSIAFVCWFFPKISETFILNQIIFLKKKGYKVLIFAIKNPSKELAKEDINFEKEIHDDVINYKLLDVVFYGSVSELYKIIIKKIKKKEIDILYFQFPDLASNIMKYGDFCVPTIVIFHDIPRIKSSSQKKMLKDKYSIVFSKATLIFAISNFTKKELIKLGCEKSKILIHHMGVDTNRFNVDFKSKKDDFNFLMIGRFVEKKGFIFGIRAFKKITDKNYKYKPKLHIIGDGIIRNSIKNEVKKLKLEEHICFYGKLSQKRIVEHLKSIKVLICPSLTTGKGKREGLPVVLLEAASCGIPIIATDHAAHSELIKEEYGILVKEKSIFELKKAMIKMMKNYPIYKKKAKKLREVIYNNYNINKLTDDLIDKFELAKKLRNQDVALGNFVAHIKKYLSSSIFSILLVGSMARQERLSGQSDIDILVVFKSKKSISSKNLFFIKKAIFLLENELKLKTSPQIFDKSDLFQLLSPVLIKSYICDGKLVYGEDIIKLFKKKMSDLSKFDFDISILKRCLFRRYLARNYFVGSFQDSNYIISYNLAKDVLSITRNFLYVKKGLYVTSRKSIVDVFNYYYRDDTPNISLQIINQEIINSSTPKINHRLLSYVEKKVSEIFDILKKRYPKNKIDINSF